MPSHSIYGSQHWGRDRNPFISEFCEPDICRAKHVDSATPADVKAHAANRTAEIARRIKAIDEERKKLATELAEWEAMVPHV